MAKSAASQPDPFRRHLRRWFRPYVWLGGGVMAIEAATLLGPALLLLAASPLIWSYLKESMSRTGFDGAASGITAAIIAGVLGALSSSLGPSKSGLRLTRALPIGFAGLLFRKLAGSWIAWIIAAAPICTLPFLNEMGKTLEDYFVEVVETPWFLRDFGVAFLLLAFALMTHALCFERSDARRNGLRGMAEGFTLAAAVPLLASGVNYAWTVQQWCEPRPFFLVPRERSPDYFDVRVPAVFTVLCCLVTSAVLIRAALRWRRGEGGIDIAGADSKRPVPFRSGLQTRVRAAARRTRPGSLGIGAAAVTAVFGGPEAGAVAFLLVMLGEGVTLLAGPPMNYQSGLIHFLPVTRVQILNEKSKALLLRWAVMSLLVMVLPLLTWYCVNVYAGLPWEWWRTTRRHAAVWFPVIVMGVPLAAYAAALRLHLRNPVLAALAAILLAGPIAGVKIMLFVDAIPDPSAAAWAWASLPLVYQWVIPLFWLRVVYQGRLLDEHGAAGRALYAAIASILAFWFALVLPHVRWEDLLYIWLGR